jgi:hypothetical protein
MDRRSARKKGRTGRCLTHPIIYAVAARVKEADLAGRLLGHPSHADLNTDHAVTTTHLRYQVRTARRSTICERLAHGVRNRNCLHVVSAWRIVVDARELVMLREIPGALASEHCQRGEYSQRHRQRGLQRFQAAGPAKSEQA